MEYDTLQKNYENLMNAVVVRAAEDYVDYKIFRFRHPVKTSYKVFNGQGAELFLKSKRLAVFTEVDGRYILKELDKKIKWKQEEITQHEMYKEFIRLQDIPKKGRRKQC